MTITAADPLVNPHPDGVEVKERLNAGGNCGTVALAICEHEVPVIETVSVYPPAMTLESWLPVCPFDHM